MDTSNVGAVMRIRCQDEALGQVLCQWGLEDKDNLDYPEVLEILRDADGASSTDLYDDHGIMVWEKFEDEDPEWLADQIESLYQSYLVIASLATCHATGVWS